jgi:fido (protein-threonine AMPylation protein)
VSRAPAPDPYLDPASGVLRNLLGITDPAELSEVEAALSASRLVDLERRRLPGTYDLDHLRAFHRYILGDVNALHPFREGNGRAQRAFFSQLAHDAGHHIDWVRMDPARNVTASTAAHHGDLALLTAMLDDLVDLPHPPGPPSPGGGRAA